MITHSIKDIQQQAADFVVCAFSGNVTSDDERRLNDWLQADERHKFEYRKMLETWDDVDLLGEDIIAELSERTEPKKPIFNWRIGGAIAACFAMVAVTSAVLNNNFTANETVQTQVLELAQYSTSIGEQKLIDLPDGSAVTLNTDSKLIVDYSDSSRRLILDKGEGFFDVAKDANRPFTVDVGGQYVSALGTKFSIKREAENLTVGVIEGVVAVHDTIQLDLGLKTNVKSINENLDKLDLLTDKKNTILRANEMVMFSKQDWVENPPTVQRIDDLYSWKDGLLRMDEETMENFIGELQRYIEKDISIEDDTIADMRISGVFRLNDQAGIWIGLEQVLPIKVTHIEDRILVSSKQDNVGQSSQ